MTCGQEQSSSVLRTQPPGSRSSEMEREMGQEASTCSTHSPSRPLDGLRDGSGCLGTSISPALLLKIHPSFGATSYPPILPQGLQGQVYSPLHLCQYSSFPKFLISPPPPSLMWPLLSLPSIIPSMGHLSLGFQPQISLPPQIYTPGVHIRNSCLAICSGLYQLVAKSNSSNFEIRIFSSPGIQF